MIRCRGESVDRGEMKDGKGIIMHGWDGVSFVWFCFYFDCFAFAFLLPLAYIINMTASVAIPRHIIYHVALRRSLVLIAYCLLYLLTLCLF